MLNVNLERRTAGRGCSGEAGDRSLEDKLSSAHRLKLEVFFSETATPPFLISPILSGHFMSCLPGFLNEVLDYLQSHKGCPVYNIRI